MTRTAIRILLGLSLVPILPSLFFISYFGLQQSGLGDLENLALSLFLCEALAISLWIAIWWNRIRRNAQAVLGTTLLASAFLVTVAAPYFDSSSQSMEAIVYSSPTWMWGLWIIGTAWLWRIRPGVDDAAALRNDGESDISPQCPACAYSLRGLSEARCPECGWTGTLDAVLDASLGMSDV